MKTSYNGSRSSTGRRSVQVTASVQNPDRCPQLGIMGQVIRKRKRTNKG